MEELSHRESVIVGGEKRGWKSELKSRRVRSDHEITCGLWELLDPHINTRGLNCGIGAK